MDKIKLILTGIGVGLMVLLTGYFTGRWHGKSDADKTWVADVVSYQIQIDSMQCVVDSALARLDREFVKNQKVIIRTRIEYIEKQQDDEKEQYFALDTVGRVEHFRGWVRDLTYKQH